MTHTPKPWTIEERKSESPSGSMYTYDIVVQPLGIHFDPEDVHGWSNAQLIAAAPELLAALERVVQIGSVKPDWEPTGRMVYAAIAKARGEV